MEITIIEGARGTGKTSVARLIRQRVSEVTLVNPTGFHEDGEKGLQKISDYYNSWMSYLAGMCIHDSKILFDRFFFTERVFSEFYKSYNFKPVYFDLLDELEELAYMGVKVNLILLTINDEKELSKRLTRDKVAFANVAESVEESMKQQERYKSLFTSMRYRFETSNIKLHTIDTTSKSNDHVYTEVVEKLKASQ